MAKKLFKISMEYETYVVAENEQDALTEWWDNAQSRDMFGDWLEGITKIEEIDEAQELIEEGNDGKLIEEGNDGKQL